MKIKEAREAFKAGMADKQSMPDRQEINDAVSTARSREGGRRGAEVKVYCSVPEDEVPEELFEEIAEEYGLVEVNRSDGRSGPVIVYQDKRALRE